MDFDQVLDAIKPQKGFAMFPSIDFTKVDLIESDLKVYLTLAKYASNETNTCFPTLGLVAAEVAMSTRTVIRSIERLKDRRMLFSLKAMKTSNKGNLMRQSNMYLLLPLHVIENEELYMCLSEAVNGIHHVVIDWVENRYQIVQICR